MAGKYCLYIDSIQGEYKTQIDIALSSSDQIAITRQLNNVTNLLDPKSDFAKNLSILGTPRTLKALGFRHRSDLTNEDLQALIGKMYTAYLEYNDINVLEGEATLEIREIATDPRQGLPVFDCYITGTRYQWASKLSDMTVHSLYEYFPSFTRDDTTVRNSWDKDNYPDSYIGGTFYPFYYGATYLDDRWTLWDVRGHLYFIFILEKALESIEYEAVGFWKSWEEVRGLTIPFHGETIEPGSDKETDAAVSISATFVSQTYKDGDNVRMENPFLDPSLNPTANIIPNHWNNPEIGVYKVPYYGKYNFQGTITGTNSVVGSYFRLVVTSKLKGELLNQVLPGGPSGVGSFFISADFYQAGDTVTFQMVNDSSGDSTNEYSVNGTGQSLLISYDADWSTWPVSTDGFNLSHNVPETVTVGEILEGVAHFYGLYAITDGHRKTVEFIPAKHFYKLVEGENITEYIDFTEDVKELTPLDVCSNIIMKWKDASDNYTKNAEAFIGRPLYGDKVPDDEYEQCYELKENPTFPPTWYIKNLDSLTEWAVPIASDKLEEYNLASGHNLYEYLNHNIGLRLVYYDGLQNNDSNPPGGYSHTGQELYYDPLDGGGIDVLSGQLPYAYMADHLRAYIQNLDVEYAFGDSFAVYLGYVSETIWSSQYPTIEKAEPYIGSKTWWYDILLRVQQNRRRFRALVQMPVSKFLSISFRQLKYLSTPLLGSGEYILNAIEDYNPKTGEGFIELLQLNDQLDDCPRSFDEIGLVVSILKIGTNIYGVNVRLTNTDEIRQYPPVGNNQIFVDNNPTSLPNFYSIPGSIGSVGYSWDVFSGSGGLNPIPVIVSGQSQRRFRFVGTFTIRYDNGKECPFAYCYTVIYNSSGTLIQESLKEICSDPIEALPELTETCCFDNFVEVSADPTDSNVLPNGIDENRFYNLLSFTVNGNNIVPGAIGKTSTTFGDTLGNVDYLYCNGYDYPTCSTVGIGASANNFDNLFDFLNGLGLGYVEFVPSKAERCIKYSAGLPFEIEIERDIGGATTVYKLSYDGVNPVDYYIDDVLFSAYRTNCFTEAESPIQAITVVTQSDEMEMTVDFTKSIATDGLEAGTKGTHTYSIKAVKFDGSDIDTPIIVTFTNKSPSTSLSAPDIASLEAALGVSGITGTYGTIVIPLESYDPTLIIPGGAYEVGDIKIYDHTFSENSQSDTELDATTCYAVVNALFDQQCYAASGAYPNFTYPDIGGIAEIHNPGGVGQLATEINDILLRYDGTSYVMDRDPQPPDEAQWIETDFGAGFEANQSIHSLQGPYTPGMYTTTGVIADFIAAWNTEFGVDLYMDTTYDARLTAEGISYLGLHFRSYARPRTMKLPERVKIRLNTDDTTYFIIQITYQAVMHWGSVYWQPSGA